MFLLAVCCASQEELLGLEVDWAGQEANVTEQFMVSSADFNLMFESIHADDNESSYKKAKSIRKAEIQ